MERILVVDDEKGVCHSFKKIFRRYGYEVITATSGIEAIDMVKDELPDLVMLDISMPDMDGIETLKRLKSQYPHLPVIMMTAYNAPDRAITAMKHGAYDYLTKPFDNERLIYLVKRAITVGRPPLPVTFTTTTHGMDESLGERIIGKSPCMLEIYKRIGQIAESDASVLITGETGTGKELIARAIHQHSKRADRPFLPVNCAAIPEGILESELFGHEKGSFTGADSRKVGKFEQCNHGTMFLDEIGDMPLSLQAKLLRVLQDGTFLRIGGSEVIKTDVRIISATNKDLGSLIREGKFREDLFWRLHVVNINVPPLRERLDDIEELVGYFIHRFNKELGKGIKGVSDKTLTMFKNYHWPGNVRELQGVVYRAMLLSKGDIISITDEDWLAQTRHEEAIEDIQNTLSTVIDKLIHAGELLPRHGHEDIYKRAVTMFEHILVRKALELTGNNQTMAARLLGITRNTLREKMERGHTLNI
ncbi:MAG: sigma-54 dependent transcriptional regulator [Thermodesulfovibrionia bacterium]